MMRTFPLFAFSDGRVTVITRGQTMEQAMSYSEQSPAFPRGVTIYHVPHCPIDANKRYEETHSPGWLYRAPEWLQKQEHAEAASKGVDGVMADIRNTLRNRNASQEVTLFNGIRPAVC